MTKRNKLEDRLQELFSSPSEAEPPAKPDQPESMGTPIESAPADMPTPVASAAASSATEKLAQVASGPVSEANASSTEAVEPPPPAQPSERVDVPAVSSPPAKPVAWRKQVGGFAPRAKTSPAARSRLRMLSNRSLRFRAISAFLIVTVATVGIVTFVSDRAIRDGLTQNVGQSLKSLAVSKAQEVGSLLTDQVNILQSYALNGVVHSGVRSANAAYTGDPAAIQAEIDQLDQQWRAADAANNDADPLVQAHLNNEMASALRRFRESFPDHVEVFVTDKYGALLGSTNRTSDYYQADEGWWQAAYNGGQGDVYIGQPEFDESSAAFSVNIAVPLFSLHADDVRGVHGVLRTTLDIGALQKILAQTGHANLLLPSGEVIRPEGGFVPAEAETLAHIQGSAPADYAEFVFEGVPSLVSQAPVTAIDPAEAAIIDELGWTFIVAQDAAGALAPVNVAAQATLFTGLGTFLAAALLALTLAQVLVRPITRLTTVAEQVAEGDLSAQARVESDDEIGKLATTFNFMTTQLRETLEGLEQRVAIRTRDLTLAAEVGRGVSNVRDLDTLLANAVDLIRERFDLYYTQVYLTDAAGRSLVLRAGTGPVGQELMQRSHRLTIGPGSINGTAAAEKRVVMVADTAGSRMYRPNPLLPDTRSEMAVPLISGDRVVGVLNLQSSQPGSLSEENLSAFEALAGQLAIAIENAALFAEAEQARAEVETQARRLTREGWEEFLNAVERSEHLGYVYDNQNLVPLNEPLSPASDEGDLAVPIAVTGESVGAIHLERESGQSWTADEAELVAAVAAQIGRQVENLRLLAQAEQYRAEAEAATRRLTREGWESYLEALATPDVGYVYDLDRGQVAPLANAPNGNGSSPLSRPLKVRDETVGELAIDGVDKVDEETAALVATVAERLSEHIENLRLSEQTQAALAETEHQAERLALLNELGEQLNHATSLDHVLQITAAKTQQIIPSDRVSVALINEARDNFEILALEGEVGTAPIGTLYTLTGSAVERTMQEKRTMIYTSDVHSAEITDMRILAERGQHSLLQAPLIRGGQVTGTLNVISRQRHAFTPSDVDMIQQIVSLLAAIIENLHLFEKTQAALAKTEALYQVGAAASSIMEADHLLQEVVDLTKSSFNLYHTHVYLLDEAGDTLVLKAGAGEVGRRMAAQERTIPLDSEQSLVAQAARQRQGIIANDVRQAPEFLPHPLLPDTRAELAVPLIVGNQLLGVLDVQSDQAAHFTDEDVRIQTTLAAQVAVALHNANLYAQQTATVQRLRELDNLKSTFLANMSHELRTPLNSILGFTDVMLEGLDGPLTEPMENDLKLISRNGQHLLSLISDVLDMAKIEAGKMNLNVERFNLREVLEEVMDITGPLAREKSLALQLQSGAADDLDLQADRIRLRQVMINLVGNAIKFTEQGGITLLAEREDGHIRIGVKDTGIGVTPDQANSIFEEFSQVDTSTTRKVGGTGLGLPISRRLVELHGGRLWVESSGVPGEGSTFIIELPVAEAAAE